MNRGAHGPPAVPGRPAAVPGDGAADAAADAFDSADGRRLAEAYAATARWELLVLLPGPAAERRLIGPVVRPAARPETRVVVRAAGARRGGGLGSGQELRVNPGITVFLLVADRRVAVLGEDGRPPRIVQSADHIADLVALFEQTWAQARPWRADADRLRAEILGRLSAGATDESVAKELGVSRRTVQRHVPTAMEELGVSTRFELGMRLAAEDGGIG